MKRISVCETVKCVLIPGYVRKYETQMRTSFSQEEIPRLMQMGNLSFFTLLIALGTLAGRAAFLRPGDFPPLLKRIGVEAWTLFSLGVIYKNGQIIKELGCRFYQGMNATQLSLDVAGERRQFTPIRGMTFAQEIAKFKRYIDRLNEPFEERGGQISV